MNKPSRHPTVSAKTARVLRRAVKSILAHPAQFDMDYYGELVKKDKAHPCGTVCCLAGQIVFDHSPKKFNECIKDQLGFPDLARELLGLDSTAHLFLAPWWPHSLREQYEEAKRPATRAKVLQRRVAHFIATGE